MYEDIMRFALREAPMLGLTERDMETAVCERFCAQTELGRKAMAMYSDTRNHDEIRGCGNEIRWLICHEAENPEDLQPGGALHTKCAKLLAAANAAARADIRSILRGD